MNKTIEIQDLNSKQYEILMDIISNNEAKYFILRSSRQAGKTFLIIRLAIYLAYSKSNQIGAFVSASYKQFTKVFKEVYELCPELIKHIDKGNDALYFHNGSSLLFFTAKNYNAITGNTFDFLLGDEVALWPNDALGYITPVLAAKKDAKCILCSTPRGKGPFWDYCQAGMDETRPFYKHYRMMYTDNEHYDLREVEEKRKSMPEAIFRSEYMGEFVFGKSNVFGEFAEYQKISKWPDYNPNKLYYFGIDWAGTGEDSTILTIIDEDGNTIFIYEPMSTSIPEQVELMSEVINKYHAIGYSECNGLGIGGTQMLQLKTEKTFKFWMSNESKNEIITHFLVQLRQNAIKLPTADLYPKLDNEMCSYVVSRTQTGKLTYSHEKGFHDDSVDSLLMAHYARLKLSSGLAVFEPEDDEEEFASQTPEYTPMYILKERSRGWSDGLKY